jgi:hypothetical protein
MSLSGSLPQILLTHNLDLYTRLSCGILFSLKLSRREHLPHGNPRWLPTQLASIQPSCSF